MKAANQITSLDAATVGLLFALLLIQGSALAGIDSDIPQTNRVILAEGKWMPSEQDTQKGLAAVQAFLEKPVSTNPYELGEIGKILAHSKDYRVQFTGVLVDGKKVIRCNFFPREGKIDHEEDFKNWKQHEVEVFDGGFWFWHIYYDPSTGKCINFRPNGYA